jgi:hypothetical protein
MKRAVITINKDYELELRYYDKDPSYKYFNRRFEIYLLKKTGFKNHTYYTWITATPEKGDGHLIYIKYLMSTGSYTSLLQPSTGMTLKRIFMNAS